MPLYYIEVLLEDDGGTEISVLCDDPNRECDGEIAQALTAAALELRQSAQLH